MPSESQRASQVLRDGRARALAKSVSWRFLGTIGTSLIVYVFTRRWEIALSVGGVEGVAKIGLYFLHERLWDRVAFGRRISPGPPREDGQERPSR
jgi:uncharacterized membrane protein